MLRLTPTSVALSSSKSYLPERAYLPCVRHSFIVDITDQPRKYNFCSSFLKQLNKSERREGWPGCRLGRRLRISEDERRRYGGSQYERAEAGGAHGRRPERRHRAGGSEHRGRSDPSSGRGARQDAGREVGPPLSRGC